MKALKSSAGTIFKKLTVPLNQAEGDALDALKAQGFQKGHWVAQAIREKLEREGLIRSET